MRKAALFAFAVTILATGLRLWLWTPDGFTRAVFPELAEAGTPAIDRTGAIDLAFTRVAHGPTRFFSARWQGRWLIEEAGAFTLFLGADDWATLSIDGELVLERGGAAGFGTRSVTRRLGAGLHTIDARYEQHAGGAFLTTGWALEGEPMRSFADATVFPDPPPQHAAPINRVVRGVWLVAMAGWLVVLLQAAWMVAVRLRARVAADPQRWRGQVGAAWHVLARRERWVSLAAIGLVVLFATALRLGGIFVQVQDPSIGRCG